MTELSVLNGNDNGTLGNINSTVPDMDFTKDTRVINAFEHGN